MSDPVTAPAMASEVARCANGPQSIQPRRPSCLRCVVRVDLDERACRGRCRPCNRALSADGGPFVSSALFARSTLSLLWAERYADVRAATRRLDRPGPRWRGTPLGSPQSLANRAWLALEARRPERRRGGRTDSHRPTFRHLPCTRVLNAGVLVGALVEHGELDEAERALEPFHSEAERQSITAAALRHARGGCSSRQGRIAEGLEDFVAVGDLLTRAQGRVPGIRPWRSDAALAHLKLGDREAAERWRARSSSSHGRSGRHAPWCREARRRSRRRRRAWGRALLREAVHAFEQATRAGALTRTPRPRCPAAAAKPPSRSA